MSLSLSLGTFLGNVSAAVAAFAEPIFYLLLDRFTTADAAPITNPRIANVGSWTVTDAGNHYSVSGGRLLDDGLDAATARYLMTADSYARVAGRMFGFTFRRGALDFYPLAGWQTVGGAPGNANTAIGLYLQTLNIRVLSAGTDTIGAVATLTADTDYDVSVVQRGSGGYLLYRPAGSGPYTLLWVEGTVTTTPLFAGIRTRATPTQVDDARVTDLPAPWTDDYGIATDRLAGAQGSGAEFTHEANGIIEFVATSVTGVAISNTVLVFRQVDASNRWRVHIGTSGGLVLNEQTGGVLTNRGSAAAGVAAGHRVVVTFDGSTITVYSNNVQHIQYTLATQHQTATVGNISFHETSGVSDIVSWPRTINLPAGV